MEKEKERVRLTNRHVAALMHFLDELGTNQAVKSAAKQEIWNLSYDLKALYHDGNTIQ